MRQGRGLPHMMIGPVNGLSVAGVFAILTAAAVVADRAHAQTIRDDLFITDGSVETIAVSGNTIYIGGVFTRVGPPTGAGALLSPTTGQALGAPHIIGQVWAAAPDGDGGWFIGGSFTRVGGLPRTNLAHIDASSEVTAWAPEASSVVYAIVVSSGTVYVGGAFAYLNNVPRSYAGAIDATTGAVTGWNPSADASVFTLLVSGATVYAGGAFANIGGAVRNRIAALDYSTGAATSWNPDASGPVRTLALSGSTLYVGGLFATIGSASRSSIAALSTSTGLATSWNPGCNGEINSLAVSGNTIYAGGFYSIIGNQGAGRSNIAAISATTAAATAWNPGATSTVFSVAVSGSTVYIAGSFPSVGVQQRSGLAAIDTTTGVPTSWNPSPSGPAQVVVPGGGVVFAGGNFTSVGGQTRNRIAALDATTGLVTSWNPNANGFVNSIAVTGGIVLVGGSFTHIGGQFRDRIAAISATTGLATAWNPSADGQVNSLVVSGTIVFAGGGFANIGSRARPGLAALDLSSDIATSWNPGANSLVRRLELDGSTLYAGGLFTTLGGEPRNYLGAVDVGTGVATSWDPNANGEVFDIEVVGSRVYVGGGFASVGGQTRNNLAAIDATTGEPTGWNPNVSSTVYALEVAGGSVYFGGAFGNVGTVSRPRLAAVDATTGQLLSWNPAPDFNVRSMLELGSEVLVGGEFTNIGGLAVRGIASVSKVSASTGLLGATWDPAGLHVSNGGGWPYVLADGSGGAIIVWEDFDPIDTNLRAARLTAEGRIAPGWYPGGTMVCDARNRQVIHTSMKRVPRVVSDGTGGVICPWLDFRNGVPQIFAQRFSASGTPVWLANGLSIGPAAVRAEDLAVVAAGDGGAYFVWSDSLDGNFNIYSTRKLPSGGAPSGWGTFLGVTTASGPQVSPAAASDGKGGMIVAWRDERPGHLKGDIYAQRIAANAAARWAGGGIPVCVQADSQYAPQVIPDGRGGAIIWWLDGRSGSLPRIFAKRVDSTGVTVPGWASTGASVSPSAIGLDGDAVADGTGGAIFTWRTPVVVMAQRLSAAGVAMWAGPGVAVASVSGATVPPRIVSDGAGGAIVTWESDGALLAKRLLPTGATAPGWGPSGTEVTSPPPTDAVSSTATSDGNGGVIVVWRSSDSARLYAQRIRHDGAVGALPAGAWLANGSPAATPPGVQQRPAIVSNAQGGVILVWEDYRNPAPAGRAPRAPGILGPGHAIVTGIKIIESGDADGEWTPNGHVIAPSEDDQYEPTAVTDDLGGAIVAWTEVTGSGSDIRAQHVLSNSDTHPGWPAGGLPLHTLGGVNAHPAIARDGLGGAIVAWERTAGANGQDIVAQRVRAGGALTWGAGGLVLCNSTGDQRRPVVIEDGAGGAYISWTDGRGANLDVYGVHVDSTGAVLPGWSANGSPIASAAGDQDQPAGVADGVGGAVLVWRDARSGQNDLYAQRCADRQPQTWASAGVAITTANGDQTRPRLASDLIGGAIVAWEDSRPGSNGVDLYAMRVLGTGTLDLNWTAGGVALCTATGNQLNPQLVSDGQGGAIVMWEDDRSGTGTDIYAMGIGDDGVLDPLYPVDGLEVTTADGSQNNVVISSDGSGGSIVAWSDGRGTDPDIFAMHLFGTGQGSPLSVGDRPRPAWVALAPPWPNPSRGTVSFAFELAATSAVRLEIFDVSGRRVRQLAREDLAAPGRHLRRWDGRDGEGAPVAAGMYFAQLRVGPHSVTRRFALTR